MNIVFGTDSFFPVLNGVATHILMYARLLARDGHKVLIIAPRYPGVQGSEDLEEGISIKRFPSYSATKIFFMRNGDERFVTPFCKASLYTELDLFAPDIIHCHTEFSVGHKLKNYAKKRHVPIVMTAHTYFEYYMQFYFFWLPKFLCRRIARGIEYHFFKHADCLITPTEWMKKTLRSYKITKDIHVIPTGMQDEDYLPPNSGELELFHQKNPLFQSPVLLFVGRVTLEKNILFLLDAFAVLVEEYPELQLAYVGKGFADKQLKEKVKRYKLEKQVHILSPVPRDELKLYYHSCKIFAFPSIGETQGLVVLEALLAGKPVAGVDSMGVGETMHHQNYGGMLSQEGNLEEYIENIRKLLSDPVFYEQKCSEAKELARSFHILPSYNSLLRLYEGLLP